MDSPVSNICLDYTGMPRCVLMPVHAALSSLRRAHEAEAQQEESTGQAYRAQAKWRAKKALNHLNEWMEQRSRVIQGESALRFLLTDILSDCSLMSETS